jgi:hypothetical protein
LSTFRKFSVQCVCRHNFEAELAVAINAERMPELRKAIVEGRLHRLTCPSCGRKFTVEKQFVYVDLQRSTIIHVRPPRESHLWRHASAELDRGLERLDWHGVVRSSMTRRLAFGIGELRDKLIAQDAKLDDRHVELAKVLAIHEHPVLLRRPRLRMFLDRVHDDRIEFFAGYDHAQQAFRTSIPRSSFDRLAGGGTGANWVKSAHKLDIFQPQSDHWVSIRRWAPSNTALGTLHDAAAQARRGQSVDFDSDDFKTMLEHLPRGSQLTTTAKVDLRDLEKLAKSDRRSDVQEALFKIRFGVELDDEWGLNKKAAGIDTLWALLNDLPDTNVEGNSHIHEIFLEPGNSGGTYNPSSEDVNIAVDLTNADEFQNTVRHEIGHAVQKKLDAEKDGLVCKYLSRRFGWVSFPGTTAGATQWVDAMKGWSGHSSAERARIADALVKGLGPGKTFTPPPPPNPPAGDPWWAADFAPRLALTRTLENWYDSNARWYRHQGNAYFVNYFYREFMVVSESTLDFINSKMPWNYAAMSPHEFFAEMYALYYRLDARDRANIERPDLQWFAKNIGKPRNGAVPAPATPGGAGASTASASEHPAARQGGGKPRRSGGKDKGP